MPKKFKAQEANQIIKDLKDKALAQAEASASTAAGAQAEVEKLMQLEADVAAEAKAQYDQGYADGKASVVLPTPDDPEAKYTQAQLDQAVAEAKAELAGELQPKIDQAVSERDSAMAHAEEIKATAEAAILDLKAKDDLLADEALDKVKGVSK